MSLNVEKRIIGKIYTCVEKGMFRIADKKKFLMIMLLMIFFMKLIHLQRWIEGSIQQIKTYVTMLTYVLNPKGNKYNILNVKPIIS